VVKAVLVNANCVSQGAARSAARLASIAAASATSKAAICVLALVAIEAKRVADLTNWDAQLTLTNTALATATTAVTNASSAMNDDNIDPPL
jgi:Tfp pilus assembly major pilin PilA